MSLCLTVSIICRAESFRIAFAEIGTLRSIIPRTVKVLALTATAKKETFDYITKHLSMQDPIIIGLSPDRSNIKYSVKNCLNSNDLCSELADELMTKQVAAPKTVLFCRSLRHCADLYTIMKKLLGDNITEPPGVQNTLNVRIIDLFTAASTPKMRKLVLSEFCKNDTKLRLLIATTAFGLGVDCPDIARIITGDYQVP